MLFEDLADGHLLGHHQRHEGMRFWDCDDLERRGDGREVVHTNRSEPALASQGEVELLLVIHQGLDEIILLGATAPGVDAPYYGCHDYWPDLFQRWVHDHLSRTLADLDRGVLQRAP